MQVAQKKRESSKAKVKSCLPEPGPDLYKAVRIGFQTKDTSLNAWCLAEKIMRQNAKQALTGAWNGPKARELRDRLIDASGIGH